MLFNVYISAFPDVLCVTGFAVRHMKSHIAYPCYKQFGYLETVTK